MSDATRGTDAIADALFGRARRAILALLFDRSRPRFYLRQIAQLTDLAVGSVQRELANLVRAGLVERMADGPQVYFRANEQSPIYPDLVGLMTKTAGIAGVLRAALAGSAKQKMIIIAFVYGSVATGTHRAASDIDLMIIGSVKLQEIIPVLRGPQEQLGREINATIYRPEEFKTRLQAGDHFLGRVIETPRLMLIGTEHDLTALAG